MAHVSRQQTIDRARSHPKPDAAAAPRAHGIPRGGCSALPALWGRKLKPEPVSSIPGEVPGGT